MKYYHTEVKFPDDKEVYGRWIGPFDIGPAMCSKILQSNGQYRNQSTFRALTEDELHDPKQIALRDAFDKAIMEKLGRPMSEEDLSGLGAVTPEHELYKDDQEGTHTRVPNIVEVTPEDFDNYVGAEVTLPLGGTMRAGKVKRRARDASGALFGTSNTNPILDTRTYQVEFLDGDVAEYSANVIAENMFAQCDSQGNQHLLIEAIVDHRRDDSAVRFADRFVVVNGRQHYRKTTVGWKLCMRWKDGSTTWERLADLKESYPVDVAEYAVAQGIDHEPAFGWWVPYVLKKRDRIVASVSKRYHKRTHKFGFEVPKTVKRAKEIDLANGNTLWQDAIAKEMEAVRVAFEILHDGRAPPIGHQEIKCHLIFDIK